MLSAFSSNQYVVKIKGALKHVFPTAENIGYVSALSLRAAIWAAGIPVLIAMVALPVLIATKLVGSFESAARVSLALAFGGAGSMLNFESSESLGLVGSNAVGVHVGLITLATVLIARGLGRRIADDAFSDDSKHGFFSLYVGLGFSLTYVIFSILGQGLTQTSQGSFTLEPLDFGGAIAAFLLVSFAAFAGFSAREYALKSKPNFVTFAVKSVGNFIKIYSVMILAAIIVFILWQVIEPDFSVAHTSSPYVSTLTSDQGWAVFWAVILLLPNILIQLFAVATGASFGFDAVGKDASFSLTTIQNLNLPLDMMSTTSILNRFGPIAFVAVALVVVTVAMISGRAAARSLGYEVNTIFKHSLNMFVIACLTWFAINLAGYQVRWQITDDAGVTSNNWLNFGVTFISALGISTVVSFLAAWASSRGAAFTDSAFPRLSAILSETPGIGRRSKSGTTYGIVFSILLLAAYVAPVAASTTNRIWAQTADGPLQAGTDIASKLETMPLKDLKALFVADTPSTYKWLSDSILNKARPAVGSLVSASATNNLGNAWSVGNLDASVTTEIRGNEAGHPVTVNFETTAEMSNPFPLLEHPVFKPLLKPTVIKIGTSSSLASAVAARKKLNVTINGQPAAIGTFLGIPGAYLVTSNGFELVAPTKQTFYSTGDSVNISVGNQIQIPKGGNTKIEAAIGQRANACAKMSSNGSSGCFGANSVLNASKIISGSAPSGSSQSQVGGFVGSNVKCDSSHRKDNLLSSSKMRSVANCTMTVKFKRTYYRTVTVQKSRCVGQEIYTYGGTPVEWNSFTGRWEDSIYYYYPDEVSYVSCYTHENYSEDVRGPKVADVLLQSEVKFSVTAIGTLDKKGKFTAKVN